MFTIKEGTEGEMLFAFALMDKPNWASWYGNNDGSRMIFTVRLNDITNSHMAPAWDWPSEVMLNWPERNDLNPLVPNAVKKKKVKFAFKHLGSSMKLRIDGYELTEFEEKFSRFYLDSTLPGGKRCLSVSGLNDTFEPEYRSTLVLHNVATALVLGGSTTSSESAAASSESAGGDGADEESSASVPSAADEGAGTSLLWLWIVIATAVLAGAAVFFVIKTKNRLPAGRINRNKGEAA